MGLLTVAMLAASLCRNLPIPYTVFLVMIGMSMSALSAKIPALSVLQECQLIPDLVFFIFLPALIFESALTLDARQLLKDVAPIFVLAVPALVISTLLIGVGIWFYMGLDPILALLFGALIAATDPVAVVALFKELGAPTRLTTLVEGESLFNDATAIVVFHILLGIALAWFLARFQRARLSQGVQRDIAGILCGEAVMKNLRLRAGLEPSDVDKVVDIYQRRVGRKRKRVDEIRGDFPEIFATLEARLTQTAALASAHNHTPMSFHHGNIGAKAFSRIERLLNSAKDRIPAITNPNAGVDPVELIEQIPLFDGLSSDAISALAARAQTVTFFMGDIVIGQNEKGNALYIIMYGIVDVFQDDNGAKTRVGTLSRGEFFGEVALLGDEVRTATVTAKTSLTLLRVTRRTVLSLAEKHADIAERLEHAHSQRR